jgi:hypothetical protein
MEDGSGGIPRLEFHYTTGGELMSNHFSGIDISKDSFHAALIDDQG